MNLEEPLQLFNKPKMRNFIIIAITSGFAFLLRMPVSPSQDALSIRFEFQNSPNNWFGGLTPLIYGIMPGGENWWYFNASLFQTLLFVIGFLLLIQNYKISRIYLVFLVFFGASFSSWVIRDSLCFALVFFSLGCCFGVSEKNRDFKINKVIIVFGLVVLVLGLSIRPFLSIAFMFCVVPLIRTFVRNKIVIGLLLSIFVVSPLISDTLLSSGLKQKQTYPVQQVIIFDLAQIGCWSSNENLRKEVFDFFSAEYGETSQLQVCGNLRPYNWQFIVRPELPTNNLSLRVLNRQDSYLMGSLIKKYLQIALERPDEIAKIKLRNFAELFFANGQFEGLSKYGSVGSGLFKIVDKLHLFSWFFFSLLLLCLKIFKSFSFLDYRNLDLAAALYFSGLTTIPLVSVFYVGAIGRYTFLSTFLIMVFLGLRKFSTVDGDMLPQISRKNI